MAGPTRANFRQSYCVAHAAILIAAAAQQGARGPGTPGRALRETAQRASRWGRRYAQRLRSTEPLFLAGRAAWEAVTGSTARAARGFVAASSLARARGLDGEAFDVATVARRFAPGSGRAA